MRLRQEADRLPERRVLVITLGAVLITAGGVVAAWALGTARAEELGRGIQEGSVPLLKELHGVEMERYDERNPSKLPSRMQAHQELEEWQWVDKDRGVVRPPIDVAIELYLERHGEQR